MSADGDGELKTSSRYVKPKALSCTDCHQDPLDCCDIFVNAGTPLILGGSFNPPHHGHLITARAVAERAGFRRVRLMVAGAPPHKPGQEDIAPAADRVAMCRAAVAGDPSFEVDDRETRRAGPSYTLLTARELQAEPEFAGQAVPWLIGADLLPGLMTWHEAEQLLAGELVRFVVMARPGSPIDWKGLPPAVAGLRGSVIEAPQIDISATEIRRRVKEGRDIRYLVPEAVRDYIHDQGLYRR